LRSGDEEKRKAGTKNVQAETPISVKIEQAGTTAIIKKSVVSG
jgi:hypothetical protein